MLRVYLDQMHWISLAKADHGRIDGDPFRDVLALAEAGVEMGRVSFPLSSAHYLELAGVTDHDRRARLAKTMARISRFHAIAPQSAIQPTEIDKALKERFGRPARPRRAQVFGLGIAHVLANPELLPRLPSGLASTSPEGIAFREEWEMVSLSQPPEFQPAGLDPRVHQETCRKFRSLQEEYAMSLAETGTSKANRRRLLAVQCMKAIMDPLSQAMEAAGIRAEETAALGIDRLMDMLKAIPTANVDYEIWCLRHDNPNRPWKDTDLLDMMALNVAVPYCKVVVTEKDAADTIHRAKLDEAYGTTVVTKFQDLIPILARS